MSLSFDELKIILKDDHEEEKIKNFKGNLSYKTKLITPHFVWD